ncbi:hypothetical protein ACSX1C_00290 [Pseudomonas sp. MBLB4123]|uniref:hypothetical protein n=1 Tax=Pseudomonas sp. MBLB4123 TaxID=3451557 RepID=UPI003F755E3C
MKILQIGDASPTFPAFVAKAWAERTKSGATGGEAMGALLKAMEKGQVKSEVMLRALELASISAKPGLALSTQTSQAEANRIANTRSFVMNEASIQGVEDGFYRVNKAIGVFAKDLAPHAEKMAVSFAQSLGAFADFSLGIRGIAKGEAGAKQSTLDAAKKLPIGYLSQMNPVTGSFYLAYKGAQAFGIGQKDYGFSQANPSPMMPSKKEWELQASQAKEKAISSLMHSSSTVNNNTVQVEQPILNIYSQATDAESLARDLEPHIDKMFNRSAGNLMGAALLQFGQKE